MTLEDFEKYGQQAESLLLETFPEIERLKKIPQLSNWRLTRQDFVGPVIMAWYLVSGQEVYSNIRQTLLDSGAVENSNILQTYVKEQGEPSERTETRLGYRGNSLQVIVTVPKSES